MHMLTCVCFTKLINYQWSQRFQNEESIGKIYHNWQIHSEPLNMSLLLKVGSVQLDFAFKISFDKLLKK